MPVLKSNATLIDFQKYVAELEVERGFSEQLVSALGVGITVSISGAIGFIGLVIPHLGRMLAALGGT